MTLFDRLLMNGFGADPYLRKLASDQSSLRAEAHKVRSRFAEHQPVVLSIDNVATYLFEGTDQEYWDLANDFPNVAPPWPKVFIEFKTPQKIVSRKYGVRHYDVNAHKACGVLLESHLISRMPPGMLEGQEPPLDAAWKSKASVFFEHNKSDISYQGFINWFVRADGTVIDLPNGKWLTGAFGVSVLPEEQKHDVSVFMLKRMWPAIYATALSLCFIHCRNTVIVDNKPDLMTIRRLQKKHKRTPVTYKTLEIEPIKKLLKHAGNAETEGLKKALHICRGHFKDYREHGLFGKYKGMYWWEMHVRGSADAGVVVKDYETVGSVDKK